MRVRGEFARRLTMFGSPPELIERALVMALDELIMATVVVTTAANAIGAVIFDPEEFVVESAVDPAVNIAVATVSSLCLERDAGATNGAPATGERTWSRRSERSIA